MGNLVSLVFESDEERQIREAAERKADDERERLRCEEVERERERERLRRQEVERERERERLRRQEYEREQQKAREVANENWRRQRALERQIREREDAIIAERREQYRQQLLHWDHPATVTSSDGAFAEFRYLNTQVVLELFDKVPRGVLLKFTEDMGAHAKKWSTHMVGKFHCKQQKGKKQRKGLTCSSWTSGKIYTEMYFQEPNGSHDSYKTLIRVWTQCCRKCNAKVLPRLEEDTYRERVVSRLQLWLGLRGPIHVEKTVASGLPPHRQDLCSACRAGKCQIAKIAQSTKRGDRHDRRSDSDDDYYDYYVDYD